MAKHTKYTCTKNPDGTYSMTVECEVNAKTVKAVGTLTQKDLESLAATHIKVDCQNRLRGKADTPAKWWYGKDTKESTQEFVARRKAEGATKEEIWDELKDLVD